MVVVVVVGWSAVGIEHGRVGTPKDTTGRPVRIPKVVGFQKVAQNPPPHRAAIVWSLRPEHFLVIEGDRGRLPRVRKHGGEKKDDLKRHINTQKYLLFIRGFKIVQ